MTFFGCHTKHKVRHTVKYFCGTRDFPDVKIIASFSSGGEKKNITGKL